MINLIPDSYVRKWSLKALQQIERGELYVTTPERDSFTFSGDQDGPTANLKVNDWKVIRGLAERGDIAFGEDYITGLWETDNLENVIAVFVANADLLATFGNGHRMTATLLSFYNRFIRRNSRRGSRANIKAHYDVGNEFYRLWLDPGMTYSSALYRGEELGLYDAQQAKYRRILDKVEGGKSLLEVGCGWGGFAEAALGCNHQVTGLTISPAQHEYAAKRLGSHADIQLKDYRDIRGTFDTIVSIEMFEAVGEGYWETFFQMLKERLKQSGKAIIQTITIGDDYFDTYRRHSDFIRHYVFPGGMLPSIRRFKEEAKKAGLQCKEVFSFGDDYARTLRSWLQRFEERLNDIRDMGYSESLHTQLAFLSQYVRRRLCRQAHQRIPDRTGACVNSFTSALVCFVPPPPSREGRRPR